MPESIPPKSGERSLLVSAGTLGTRVWDFIARLAILTTEQERHKRQLDKMSEQLAALAARVEYNGGQLDGLEKRFDDKDKHIATLIELEITKLRGTLNTH